MLALAIILTLVTGLLFAIAFALGGYIAYVKIREFHRNNVANPNSGTATGERPDTTRDGSCSSWA